VRQAAAAGDVVQQRLDQGLHVLQPLAQRRQADRQHVQPVVQVGAELAAATMAGQVAAGGGDHAHVHADRPGCCPAARPPAPAARAAACLQRQRHVADLVEEQRAAVGQLELAVAALAVGAGVGAGGHAEELGLQQRLGHGGDVDAHERLAGAGLAAWMACASSSLPVPVSPSSSTVASVWATRRAWRLTSSAAGLLPM
jgi:hypothetical protein